MGVLNPSLLAQAADRVWETLPEDRRRKIQHFASVDCSRGPLDMSSMCSASEVWFDAHAYCMYTIEQKTNIGPENMRPVTQPFACEIDKDYQRYIINKQFSLSHAEHFQDCIDYLPEAQKVFEDCRFCFVCVCVCCVYCV